LRRLGSDTNGEVSNLEIELLFLSHMALSEF